MDIGAGEVIPYYFVYCKKKKTQTENNYSNVLKTYHLLKATLKVISFELDLSFSLWSWVESIKCLGADQDTSSAKIRIIPKESAC